jgi:hypothetical protein
VEDKTDKSFLIIVLIYKVNIVVCLLVVIFILFLLLICRHKKREPTAIGSFGHPLPLHPIYAESPRVNVSVSHYSRNEVSKCG